MSEAHKKIGEKLKARREKLGLSLEDISEDIKTSIEYLQAIENGEIASFPSNVYYDMFARSYAKEMDMNTDELFEELKMTEEPETEPEPSAKSSPKQSQRGDKKEDKKKGGGFSFIKLSAWLGGIIILIFIVIVVWSVMGNKSQEPSAVQSSENTVTENQGEAAPPSQESSAPAEDSTLQEVKIDMPEYEPVKKMNLQVVTRDSCWVMVLADGDTVLNRNLPGGAVRTLDADYRFLISAGNPNVLDLRLDGQLLKPLSQNGRPYRDREINQMNKKNYLAEPEGSKSETP